MSIKHFSFKTEKGEPFDIPIEGSLGLLAYGYIGIMLWREKRQGTITEIEVKKTSNTKPST